MNRVIGQLTPTGTETRTPVLRHLQPRVVAVPDDRDDRGKDAAGAPSGPGRAGRTLGAGFEQRLILALDLAALVAAWAISGAPARPTLVYALLVLLALRLMRACEPRFSMRVLDHLPRWLLAIAVPLFALVPWMVLQRPDAATFEFVGLAALLLLAGRTASFSTVVALRRRGRIRQRALIAGAGNVGVELARQLRDRPEFGAEPVGFADTEPPAETPPAPYLGHPDDLAALLRESRADCLIIAFGSLRECDTIDGIRTALTHGVDVYVVPRFFELGIASGPNGTDEIWGIPVCRADAAASRRALWPVKRAFDIMVAASALVLTAPVMAIVAIAVKLDHGGPVLFKQQRVGQRGRCFELVKFRSIPPADSNAGFSVEEDGLSAVGRFIRRSSIDELPQLWNILRGDMSVIGPRPERVEYVEQFCDEIPGYEKRHRLPVGLTGWAQVNGLRGGGTSITERARFDNVYIERWSLWLDVTILLRTVKTILGDVARSRR